MGRASTIQKLSPELRKELDGLLREGRLTQKEITQHLRKLGADVSKSSVGRYAIRFDELEREYRMLREVADRTGKELGDSSDHTRVISQHFQVLLMRARMQVNPDDPIDEKKLKMLSEATRNFALAFKTSADAEAKIIDRVAKQAAGAVEKVAKEQGLSKSTVEALKAEVLGISQPAPTPETPQ